MLDMIRWNWIVGIGDIISLLVNEKVILSPDFFDFLFEI